MVVVTVAEVDWRPRGVGGSFVAVLVTAAVVAPLSSSLRLIRSILIPVAADGEVEEEAMMCVCGSYERHLLWHICT